jgi:glucose-6-phosphate isomerase
VLLSLANDAPEQFSCCFYQRFDNEHVLERLRTLDARVRRDGLEALDPESDPLIRIGMEVDGGRVVKNSYGVFNLSWQAAHHPEWAERIEREIDEIRQRIRDAHKAPLRFLLWAGMGGSAEDKSMYNAAGLLRRGPRCYVLDSTDPAKLKYVLEDIEKRHGLSISAALKSTLVVGMAMGMTSYEPVVNLEKVWALYERYHIDGRPNFLYMTLPGSLLDQFAGQRGWRKVELQPDNLNTTAGRHSGPLTRGSLYPLALSKADLRSWIAGTLLSDEDILTAWRLAAFIHAQGLQGRDKLTLMLPKHWSAAALWTKQDFEESLGKSEKFGLKVVIGDSSKLANYRSPRDPAQDRAFLAVQVKGLPGPDARKLALLRRAGYPVAVLTLPRLAQLSTYMQLIHYAVFGVGYLRDMNFVTQPGVELYKSIANRIYSEAQRAGGVHQTGAWRSMAASPRQARFCDAVTLHYGRLCAAAERDCTSAPQIYASALKRLVGGREVEYGELTFFGDTRYSPQGAAVRKRLEKAAEELFASRLKMPADVYEGPAMNHSYHEMIIGHGRCFSTVVVSERQEQLPAAQFSADYHVAQFLATESALAERGRPVVAITLKNLEDSTVRSLGDFFHQAAGYLKR